MIAGILATLIAVPVALYGAFVGAVSSPSAENWGMASKLLLWSFGGLIGISAAWVRVVFTQRKFEARPTIAHTVTVGLTIGVLSAAWMLIDALQVSFHAALWFLLPALGIGLFLLAGHLAERRNAL